MKPLLFALLLFVSLTARAQLSVSGLPSTVGGTCSKHVYVEDSVGFFIGWYCPSTKQIVQMWAHWSDLAPNWRQGVSTMLATGDLSAFAQIPQCTKNAAGACLTPADLDGVVKPGWAQLVALLPPPPPPPPTFVVAPDPFTSARAVFRFVPGTPPKRGAAISGVTVPPGTPCDSTVQPPVVESVNTYMAVTKLADGSWGIAACKASS